MDNYFILPTFWHKLIASLLLIGIGFVCGLFYFFSTADHEFVFYKLQKPEVNRTQNIITKKYLESVLAKTVYPEKSGAAEVSGLIVNHHLLADQLIVRGLYLAATDSPITIILLSPNHFSLGRGMITMTKKDWLTPAGYLRCDTDSVQKLAESGIAEVDDRPFEGEHGVANIIPFIKKLYPQAKIVPIIVKDGLNIAAGDQLVAQLQKNLPENSLIIASLDFSHYRTSAEADIFDLQTLRIIQNNDYRGTASLNKNGQPDNVDSLPTLRIMLQLMAQRNANFVVLDHTNADKMSGNLKSTGNTSYIVGAFYK